MFETVCTFIIAVGLLAVFLAALVFIVRVFWGILSDIATPPAKRKMGKAWYDFLPGAAPKKRR